MTRLFAPANMTTVFSRLYGYEEYRRRPPTIPEFFERTVPISPSFCRAGAPQSRPMGASQLTINVHLFIKRLTSGVADVRIIQNISMSTRGVLLGEVGPCVEYFEAAVAGDEVQGFFFVGQ